MNNENKYIERLIQECNITLEKHNLLYRENQIKLDELSDKVDNIKEWISEVKLLTKEEFASLCNVKAQTIHKRLLEGLYETPKGFTERAYYNQGNQGNQLFVIPLALNYYEINIKNEHK